MASRTVDFRQVVWTVLLVLIIVIAFSEARGGRGGGSRSGGSRSSRYGGSRSRSSSARVTATTQYRTTRYGPSGYSTRTAMTAGIIVGSSYYMRRRIYRSHSYKDPQVCYNRQKYYRNSTVTGYFICPSQTDADDYTYCCGSASAEYCCGYLDSSARVGAIVGGCIGGAVGLFVIIFVCCLVCRSYKKPAQPVVGNTRFRSQTNTVRVSTVATPASTSSDLPYPIKQWEPYHPQGVGLPPPYPGNDSSAAPSNVGSAPPYPSNSEYPPSSLSNNGHTAPYSSSETQANAPPYPSNGINPAYV